MRMWKRAAATAFCLALFPRADAQFMNQWVSFSERQNLGTSVYSFGDEADAAAGDLDQDGFVDLVVVVKQEFTSPGKRRNKLLMNESGTLVDRTALYAVASDVPGDQGFDTPTNDRDVVIDDVDLDGFLDFVTATTISPNDPKEIGHPRVYKNLGTSGGAWSGMRHESARFPQLLHFGTGLPTNPRFCSVAAGDVTGDGAPDLYFGDYDSSGAGGSIQPSNEDLNDRLLINDGQGFFSDQSQTRMTPLMLNSAFGMAVEIADVNLDGWNDVIKDTALMSPQHVAAILNDPNNPGFFNLYQVFHNFAPYHIDVGELNNDGRPDIVISDDFQDRYRYNLGNDVFGQPSWGAAKSFQFLAGGDDGFGSNNLIVDLDGDGWNDVLVCDVDVDIAGYGRRLHIYRNPGGVPGSEITLIEEREQTGNNKGPGWLGAVGLENADLQGMHDVAAFDVDNDQDLDLVLFQGGSLTRVRVMENKGPGTIVCESDAPLATQNDAFEIRVCSEGGLAAGHAAELRLQGFPPAVPILLFGSLNLAGVPVPELAHASGAPGILGPSPAGPAFVMATIPFSPAAASFDIPFTSPGGGPATYYVQAFVLAGLFQSTYMASNTVAMQLLP